ncbi:acetyl-CoA carboxylase biotin carboxyl carrier protein [Acidipila rosea]|uniref:Biotin carboxyl carrier protein of acetyl-CoA carboxylase n=1 Tax=Acidipila rosea TaxID=768535 RepID=A0A4R1L992_9BACT|nr:acetyl-CoA carboxylase biotin carboxyl carrier protein [Acidipila rosea]MBW4043498.1 acetyl-CoA carboxylase biotin carboxyl carrier protein [Acidobacteriota bacterium]TCK73800.1 acetyl-CoA carboxylase biotin carboxyl carrier protein [Acidipila rosea]
MNPEEIKELKELIEFLKDNNIGEFDLERGDLKVRLKFAQQQGAVDMPALSANLSHLLAASQAHQMTAAPAHSHVAPAATPSPAETAASEDAGLHIVKSPIVGTFYESPSPGTAAFVKAGDQIENGQVLCIVEAMKLMNEIEADVAGEVVRRLVQNGQPVEYGQPLFAVRPR